MFNPVLLKPQECFIESASEKMQEKTNFDTTTQVDDLRLYRTQQEAVCAFNLSMKTKNPLNFNNMVNTCCKIRKFYENHIQKIQGFKRFSTFIEETNSVDIFRSTNILLKEMLLDEEKRNTTYDLIKKHEGDKYLNLFKKWYDNHEKRKEKEELAQVFSGFSLENTSSVTLPSLPSIKELQ